MRNSEKCYFRRIMVVVIATICLALFPNKNYSQSLVTPEDVFVFYLKRNTDPKKIVISNEDFKFYCENFDRENFYKTKSNEFDRQEYNAKMLSKLKSKIIDLSYSKLFYCISTTDLNDFDFNNESFSLKYGPSLQSNHFLYFQITPQWYNEKIDFSTYTIHVKTNEARKLLETKKTTNGNTDRKVFLVAYFNFMDLNISKTGGGLGDASKWYYSIFCHRVDVYNDREFKYKIATIFPRTNSINSVSGIDNSLNNKTIVEFYTGANQQSPEKSIEGISFEEAKNMANRNNYIFKFIEYNNGNLSNPIKWFYADGTLHGTETIENNCYTCRNGPTEAFYKNGSRSYLVYYKNGKISPIELGWYENGNLRFARTFYEGQLSGAYLVYNEKGERVAQSYYYAGNFREDESGYNYKPERWDYTIEQYGFKLPDKGNVVYKPARSQ